MSPLVPQVITIAFLGALIVVGAAPERSIQEFANCSTTVDQRDGVAAGLAAASGNAFTLIFDCAVYVHIGVDIAKPIFVESGTHVAFRGEGQLWLANQLVPAFLFVNVHDVALVDWNVLYTGTQLYLHYDGTYSIDEAIGYYEVNGTLIPQNNSYAPTQFNFADITLRQYYASHRNVTGWNPVWYGPTSASATFQIIGETSDMTVTGLRLVAASERACDFMLVAFGFEVGFKNNQRVTNATQQNASTCGIPSALTFNNCTFDGVYMGMVGSVRHSSFTNITSWRYSDLQDQNGTAATMGGCKPDQPSSSCWFAPPHLFYFNFKEPRTTDAELWNLNITISDVVDHGVRAGSNHFRLGTSGNCLSLKIGAVNSTVLRYVTHRKDGAVDVVWADNLLIDSLTATYNSSFLNQTWPAWRFTEADYHGLTLANIRIVDVAAVNAYPPMWGNVNSANFSNSGFMFQNFTLVTNNLWEGMASPAANVSGQLPGSQRTYLDAVTGDQIVLDADNVEHWIHVDGSEY